MLATIMSLQSIASTVHKHINFIHISEITPSFNYFIMSVAYSYGQVCLIDYTLLVSTIIMYVHVVMLN